MLIIPLIGHPYHLCENNVYVSNNKSYDLIRLNKCTYTGIEYKNTERITFALSSFLFLFNFFCSMKILI